MAVVALLTDFGLNDGFAAQMKAVILKVNPAAQIVDISHGVDSFDIYGGAFLLWSSFAYFPKGTIFVGVVDPGVGSARKNIIIKTKNYFFVGPDNGVLTIAAWRDGIEKIVEIKNTKYFLQPNSCTFHGRDIFASVAGHLSRGINILRFGKLSKTFKQIVFPAFVIDGARLKAKIIYIDKFGNLVTNIDHGDLKRFTGGKGFQAVLRGKRFSQYQDIYADSGKEPFFIKGSSGFLEISLKNKSAKDYFGVKYPQADILTVRRSK
jgi:S-adenosyl-L-methionine hydrolase (adenosine-forming)